MWLNRKIRKQARRRGRKPCELLHAQDGTHRMTPPGRLQGCLMKKLLVCQIFTTYVSFIILDAEASQQQNKAFSSLILHSRRNQPGKCRKTELFRQKEPQGQRPQGRTRNTSGGPWEQKTGSEMREGQGLRGVGSLNQVKGWSPVTAQDSTAGGNEHGACMALHLHGTVDSQGPFFPDFSLPADIQCTIFNQSSRVLDLHGPK